MEVAFDYAHSSSGGGRLLLKAIEERRGPSEKLGDGLVDGRAPGEVQQELAHG